MSEWGTAEAGAMWSDLQAAASNLPVNMPIAFQKHPH